VTVRTTRTEEHYVHIEAPVARPAEAKKEGRLEALSFWAKRSAKIQPVPHPHPDPEFYEAMLSPAYHGGEDRGGVELAVDSSAAARGTVSDTADGEWSRVFLTDTVLISTVAGESQSPDEALLPAPILNEQDALPSAPESVEPSLVEEVVEQSAAAEGGDSLGGESDSVDIVSAPAPSDSAPAAPVGHECLEALGRGERSPQLYLCASQEYYQRQEYAQARKLLSKAIKGNKSYREAYILRAKVLGVMGKHGAAHRDIQAAIGLAPRMSDAFKLAAWLYSRQGNGGREAQSLREAIARGAPNPEDLEDRIRRLGLEP